MKVALIPPKGYFHTARRSDMHLALAQINDPEYLNTYGNAPRDHYVILDNGAAEGLPVSDRDLVEAAEVIYANEIVVPDVIGDVSATVSRAKDFVSAYRTIPFAFMAVVQGRDFSDARRCVDLLLNSSRIRTLGIPRHFLETFGDNGARARVIEYIMHHYTGEVIVHLLGTSHRWPKEIKTIANEFPWVRSVDTSMPYNYTIAGLDLATNAGTAIQRPSGYFNTEHDLDEGLLGANINTFMEWASGTEGTRR